MGFNPPVPQQDSNSEIRVAVLLSLLLQVLLIFLGPTRKRSSHPVSGFAVWSCYLLADWVADLALGLLLNNMGNIGGNGGGSSSSSFGLKRGGGATTGNNNGATNDAGSGSPIIFAFWTPFLLLHLGGPDTITSYSLEDNELWLRHLIGLLFEVFSAGVIFYCSLRGNPLILATALMFVAGIIKYGERTYSLYCGSLESFRTNILGPADPGRNYARLMSELRSKRKAGLDVEIVIVNGEASKAQKEMEDKEIERLVLKVDKSVEARAYELSLIFRRLFVDLSLSLQERRLSQAFFLHRDGMTPGEAFEVIEVELNFMYDMVYTKAPVAHSRAGWVLRSVCSGCLVSALVIFFHLDKPRHQIRPADVGVTYALLLGGLALDAVALLMLLFSNHASVFRQESRRFMWLEWMVKARRTRRWSGTVSQFNLISYSLGKPDEHYYDGTRCCHRAAQMLRVDGMQILQDLIFIRRVPIIRKAADIYNEDLLSFIFLGQKKAGMDSIFQEIKEVRGFRGERIIRSLEEDIKKALINNKNDDEASNNKFKLILDSVHKGDFDESLLLWHIATDLCFLRDKDGPPTQHTPRMQAIAETMSEYMLYLLVKQTEMVSPSSGAWLKRYRDTCGEARRFFASMDAWVGDHKDARIMLLGVDTSERPSTVKDDRCKSVLFDAVILAKALRELEDEQLMWEVIMGVWGEMLVYTAGKCRGTTHLRQLNRGGELITLVWFLMENMGLSDHMYQEGGDAKAKLIVKDH